MIRAAGAGMAFGWLLRDWSREKREDQKRIDIMLGVVREGINRLDEIEYLREAAIMDMDQGRKDFNNLNGEMLSMGFSEVVIEGFIEGVSAEIGRDQKAILKAIHERIQENIREAQNA